MNCSICGTDSKHFKTYNGRAGARCPSCWALERHREVFDVLMKNALLTHRPVCSKLLMVSMDPYYSKLCKFYDTTVLTIQKHQPHTVCGDLCNPPFKPETFDVVVQVHVLEHIKDDRKATAAVYQLLRAGGIYISNVPCRLNKPTDEFGAADSHNHGHWRLYGAEDYSALLTSCGFCSVVRDHSTFVARKAP